MVLIRLSLLLFLGVLGGCMTPGGYERYGFYDAHRDRVSDHRASFLGDGTGKGNLSMAYAIVYWDVLPQKEAKEEPKENIPEVFYIWLRNNTSAPISIDPDHLSLLTEQGKTMALSPLTHATPAPLTSQTIQPLGIVSGYVVFEIPKEIIRSDRPGRIAYEDQAGNRVVRYLQIEGMKKYEGMVLEKEVYYYAPVYPRLYWYPYYYPYLYYPFDIDFLYIYAPHRHYYYSVPTEPQRRRFLIPPAPPTREFRGSSGLLNRLLESQPPGDAGEPQQPKKPKRQFPASP
jgi:hypothetical protein